MGLKKKGGECYNQKGIVLKRKSEQHEKTKEKQYDYVHCRRKYYSDYINIYINSRLLFPSFFYEYKDQWE